MKINSKQVIPDALPPELTADEIGKLDGASGRSDAGIIVYDCPIDAASKLNYAVEFLDQKYYHAGVRLLDFNVAAYEQYDKTGSPGGEPTYLAVVHKKTGKGQAGFSLYGAGAFIPHYATASVMINELAKKDEAKG